MSIENQVQYVKNKLEEMKKENNQNTFSYRIMEEELKKKENELKLQELFIK